MTPLTVAGARPVLTPAALAAATVTMCRPHTIVRRRIGVEDDSAILTLRPGQAVTIYRRSWAADGGLYWSCGLRGGALDDDRFEAIRTMVIECEARVW